jgi:hypothetical protein
MQNAMRYSPAIGKTAARRPVELEGAVGVRDQLSVEGEGLGSSSGIRKVDEAVSSVTSA